MPLTEAQENEIRSHREERSETRRPTVPALEELLYTALPALDHGFLRVMDYMGNDAAIVQAARVSYGRGTTKVSEDRGLIRYLMRHNHSTPFEMCEIKFHAKLPIFVARQWIRHRTANVNEYSARYSILDREFYITEPAQLAAQSSTNRQGRGEILGENEAKWVLDVLRSDAEANFSHYREMLNEDDHGNPVDESRSGLARELARMDLTLNTYTQWYWKTDLHNLFNFLRLRADSHAQYEIRVYADLMLGVVQTWVPYAYEAFEEYVADSFVLSSTMRRVLGRILTGEKITQETSGLNKRDWEEFQRGLGFSK